MNTIGITKPLNESQIIGIRSSVPFPIPEDFMAFIGIYGFGNINQLIIFSQPDPDYIKNNFAEYMHFWGWECERQKREIIGSLFISESIDGDIICCIPDTTHPYVILPRHSRVLIHKKTLDDVLNHYRAVYQLEELWFQSNYDRKTEAVYLWKDHLYDPELMQIIHDNFLKLVIPDNSVREVPGEGGTYIFQNIGGMVNFDGGIKITVDYQSAFEPEAQKVIGMLKDLLETEYAK